MAAIDQALLKVDDLVYDLPVQISKSVLLKISVGTDEKRKRKRTSQSSVSESDVSMTKDEARQTSKSSKKKRKGVAKGSEETDTQIEKEETADKCFSALSKQLKDMNLKFDRFLSKEDISMKDIHKTLSSALMKNDDNLEKLLKTMVERLKEDVLKSITRQVEVLESKIFDKEAENENIKKEQKLVNDKRCDQHDENRLLRQKLEKKKQIEGNLETKANNTVDAAISEYQAFKMKVKKRNSRVVDDKSRTVFTRKA